MADVITFEIVTQVSAVYTGTLKSVTLPGAQGELGILPNHRPLLTLIRPGTVTAVEDDGKERTFAVSNGYAEISDNEATLIVTECTGAEDIDIAKAREEFEIIEERMDKADFEDEEELEEESERFAHARARVEAFEKATKK